LEEIVKNIGHYELNHNQTQTGDVMPHFIIDCSQSILKIHSQEEIIEQVYISAVSTKLFHKNDVKVRVNFFKNYSTGDKKEDFIHVFANIMEGRTIVQKAFLSKTIVKDLASIFPLVPHIGTNVVEFEKASYFNRNMLDPNYQFSMP
jgi:5-carboxymethyl-2-hydroxymuconate isomerase